MSRSNIRFLIGKILLVESALLIFPFIVSLLFNESIQYWGSYAFIIILTGIIGFWMSYKKPFKRLRAVEGAVVVSLGWLLLTFFGALPFTLSGDIPNFFDAFFETASGFTTTGSSVLSSVDALAKSNLFWRSFTHLVGGMGVLAFTLAILPKASSDSAQLLRAESPGPSFGKLLSKISDTVRMLYGIYLGLVVILVIVLMIGDVPFFDALLLSFGTAGTGGFAIADAGFTIYTNPVFVEYVIAIGMLIFGINFNLFFWLLIGYAKSVFKDEELRIYLMIVAGSVAVIIINLMPTISNFEETFRHVLFTVSSIITTTGYATEDFTQWPMFAQTVLLLLMFIGGCAGSTSGGLKVSRIGMYIKSSFTQMRKLGHPNSVIQTRFNHKVITKEEEAKVTNYLKVYILVFIVLLLWVSIETTDFSVAFSTVTTMLNNIGPGLGSVGPTGNFGFFSDVTKFILSLAMIAGRLEIYPMLILLTPSTLKRFVTSRQK